jgi:dihydrofolate synthase / folylpolyglutamate synthase
MSIKNYKETVEYLESLIPRSQRTPKNTLRLERITELLKRVGNPHRTFESIHVGGTAGKGSVCYMTAAILKEAGYTVGLHISPHLEKVNERMQVDGEPIGNKEFTALVREIIPHIERVGESGKHGKPTYFEALVALAFLYFKRKGVKLAVVEVGLGGTLDATNVIKPLVAVITNVHLDHTHILGDTVEKIARDKAGIIKEGIHVITAATQKNVREIIRKKCKEKNALLTIIKKEKNFQETNKACARAAVEALKEHGYKVSGAIIKKALQKGGPPGRFEIVSAPRHPNRSEGSQKIILDGAHNPTKMEAFMATLTEKFPKKKFTFIFAAKKTKDIKSMLRIIKPIAQKILLTTFKSATDTGKKESEEKANLLKIAQSVFASTLYTYIKSPEKALKQAKKETKPDDIIIITGSIYLVGELRSIIKSPE